ncbi:cytochrome c oxidase subunit 3 [Marinihelvus fidelis]|uniref:cytochrome-c oxidase n=1 Tax=Marinihelvus fidelis TaxID=2613842 RepID=A0A5N0TA55_9GAMM|nr:cytochrome c oxidase subunit 3 [Marinihelvus fidelis]KAA9131842.1 cytochrome c oxidase subunit 3 [Marinihelvus fidelis]
MGQHADSSIYYVPHGTKWPMVGSLGLATTLVSAAMWMNGASAGEWGMYIGLAIIIFMVFGWFGQVIRESEGGMYNSQVDASFRIGMVWFIFSEVMFFACFFGALFYARALAVPWLGGAGNNAATNELLWQGYVSAWPTNGPGEVGGDFGTIPAFGVPFLNTLILLTSGVTLTLAHHALRANQRKPLVIWLAVTVLLGALFLFYQVEEYAEAYGHLGLTLGSGIYGSTFFMLTGFHGMHVTLGAIMLFVIMIRCMRGHFKPDYHFGFEAVAWYWHFVDVVWLGLFIFVYVL